MILGDLTDFECLRMGDAFKHGRVALRNHVSCGACEKATVHPETIFGQRNQPMCSVCLGAQGRPPFRHGS